MESDVCHTTTNGTMLRRDTDKGNLQTKFIAMGNAGNPVTREAPLEAQSSGRFRCGRRDPRPDGFKLTMKLSFLRKN